MTNRYVGSRERPLGLVFFSPSSFLVCDAVALLSLSCLPTDDPSVLSQLPVQ